MKTKFIFNLKKIALLSLFTVVITLLNSCKKVDEINPADPINTKDCSTYGTIVYMPCWYSAYSNYWIKLDDGTLMRPCETDVVTLQAISWVDGQRIKFGYELSDCTIDPNPYPYCCFIYPVDPPAATNIKVTCIEAIDQDPDPVFCNLTGTVKNYQDEICGAKLIEFYDVATASTKTIEPVNQNILDNIQAGEQVTFSYQEEETFAPTCSGNPAAEITCLNSDNPPSDCKPMKIVDLPAVPPIYNPVSIAEVYIEGNCLKIKGGFSGCSDDVSRFDLIWDGIVLESNPVQVNVFITDYEPIICAAYFQNTLSFDISKLKENNSGPVIINIAGWTGTITF